VCVCVYSCCAANGYFRENFLGECTVPLQKLRDGSSIMEPLRPSAPFTEGWVILLFHWWKCHLLFTHYLFAHEFSEYRLLVNVTLVKYTCSVLHVFSFMNQAFLVIRRECAHVVLVRMHNMPILDIFDGSLFFFAVSVHNSFRR
jgi:hypothetical protein